MAKRGRPSIYSDALAATICARIAAGESARSVCRDPEMPGLTALMCWLRDRPDFAEQYARARDDRADALAEDILEIADAAAGQPNEVVQAARLRVDARKWIASKLAPKKYGERTALEHSGPDGGPVVVRWQQDEPGK